MCTSHTASSQIRIPSILDVPVESVILVSGTLASKPPSKNQSAQSEHEVHVLPDLEIKVDKWILLNAANKELPFRPNDLKHLVSRVRLGSTILTRILGRVATDGAVTRLSLFSCSQGQ